MIEILPSYLLIDYGSNSFLMIYLYLFYIYECFVCMCAGVLHACLVLAEPSIGDQMPGN